MHCFITDNNITVVATGVNTANEAAMPPHIQILSTDPNDQQQHHVQISESKRISRTFTFYFINI